MFLAGEFSNISRVSKRSLQFYDEIDLFKPAFIDEANGYRYYTAGQLSQLNQILALKDLGLSLDQIKKMLQSDVSDEEIHGMLLLQKGEMERSIRDDLQRLRRIEARVNQNRAIGQDLNVVIKSIPAQSFLAVRRTFATEEELFALIEQVMSVIPEVVKPKGLGSLAGVFWDESFLTHNSDVALGYLLKKDMGRAVQINGTTTAEVQILPAVETMASAVQVGSRDVDFMGLGRIAAWIEANGYMIAGPYREIVFEATHTGEIEGATIEIQMPVKRRTTGAMQS